MGHRKHSAPRRGSLAFLPRKRASSIVPIIRTWPEARLEKPSLLGFAGFKAGMISVITIDDREHTPNFGKPRYNSATVIATPPITICGVRAYRSLNGGLQVITDIYTKELPEDFSRKTKIASKDVEQRLRYLEENSNKIAKLNVLACVRPRDAGLSQRTPFVFEIRIGGGDVKSKLEYAKALLGKLVKVTDVAITGGYLDVAAVSKGKGFEGPVTRLGVKRKQHKSRKSVRAIGVLGPWHPSSVMYTIPRAGQHGFHQRVEYNKRVLIAANGDQSPVTPSGGFPHFGTVRGDYLVVKGSVPGPSKRLVRLRLAIRSPTTRVQPAKIIEISTIKP